jgi:hypothetical protein
MFIIRLEETMAQKIEEIVRESWKELDEPESFNSFEAGQIHKPEFYDFWEKELASPPWILEILKEGYKLPLKEYPPKYHEQNNKTVRENMHVVRQLMAEMISKGVVKVTKEPPHIVSPLGLVTKSQDGVVKHRLVYDASRHLNMYLNVPHVKLNHLDRALEITQLNDLQITYDLTSAYYHIKIHPDHQKLLGAAFENSDGKLVYVYYTCLPFGIASAVHAITKIWKPITRYLNKNAIRNTIYIDDGRILAQSPEEAERQRIFTYDVIKKAGWAIEKEKSDKPFEASTTKKYLGFIIDTKAMKVESSTQKLERVEKMVAELLKMKSIPIKKLASVVGNIIALEHSHGMLARVTTRSGYVIIAEHTEKFGWIGSVAPTAALHQEFKFFLQESRARNGCPIKNENMSVRIETFLHNPIAKTSTIPNHPKGSEIMVSDASNFKAYVYDLQQGNKTEFVGVFNDDEQLQSSGARELLSILWTLRQWKSNHQHKQKNVYWITDSENVVQFIKKGSRRPEIQKIIFEIVQITSELKIHIEPVHLRREDPRIQEADEGSKHLDTDNWSLDYYSMTEIFQEYTFDIDLFADRLNRKCETFCSLYYQEEALTTDAFSIPWKNLGFLWICPPVKELIRIHQRITSTECQGLLILPIWKTANFFPLYFQDDNTSLPPFICVKIWSPYIIQNEEAKNTALFGQVNFQMAALFFDTVKRI